MIDALYFLPQDKAGAIYREVLDYPQAKVPGSGDLFYWEKIDFGQEPTVRVSHLMLFPQGAGAVKFIAAKLARELADIDATEVDPAVIRHVLDYFGDLTLPYATKKVPRDWTKTLEALDKLRASLPAK